MYLSIDTSQRIDLREVKAARLPCGDIWLYAGNDVGRIYMDDEAARELVRQLQTVLDEPKPEPLPDPRGYVFIDADGDAWGWGENFRGRNCKELAKRPFATYAEAEDQGRRCSFRAVGVEVWTPASRVPPMPEGTP